MVNIREIFATNLRENRRKCGLTQAKLAEKCNVSTHYVALIEMARNIPKVDIIERFAKILNIEIYQLFLTPNSYTHENNTLNQNIIDNIKEIVKEAVSEAFEKEKKTKKATKKN